MYDVLKDFASPVITLITALIAGFITFTFNRNQAQLARSQRDIALDKLKFDLFSLVCKSAERHVEVTVDHAKRVFLRALKKLNASPALAADLEPSVLPFHPENEMDIPVRVGIEAECCRRRSRCEGILLCFSAHRD